MTGSPSGSWGSSSGRSSSAGATGSGKRPRISLRSVRRSLRLALKVLRLFGLSLLLSLTVATWSSLRGTGTAKAAPPITPVTVPASFDTWEPCTTSEGLTVTEWAECSQAYNTDRIRSLLSISLVLIVGTVLALYVLSATR